MRKKRRIRLAAWIVSIAVLALPVAAQAQVKSGPIAEPPAAPAPQKTAPAPKLAPPPVSLDVLVTDEDGVVLAGLKKDNFRVRDNGKLQTITHFEPVGAPITIVMLLESSSAAYNYFAYKTATWGARFLDSLQPLDYVALVTYDIKPRVRVDFTRNKAKVQQALATYAFPTFREANLHDALIDTLDRLERVKGKTAVLIIGTGANSFSRTTLKQTLRRIKESDVTIFAVGVAEAEYRSAGGTPIAYLQIKNALQSFAKLTGGMAWFPRFQGEIPGIFRSVSAHLRGQYRLGFSPPPSMRDGKYHKLKVEIVGPAGNRLVVTNPKGKRRKVEVYTREGYLASREGGGK